MVSQRARIPTTFEQKRTAYLKQVREPLVADKKRCGAIVVTPVAFREMMNHTSDLEPHLIVVDEAARLSEHLCLLPMSKCPNTPCIFIRDRCSPVQTDGHRTRSTKFP